LVGDKVLLHLFGVFNLFPENNLWGSDCKDGSCIGGYSYGDECRVYMDHGYIIEEEQVERRG